MIKESVYHEAWFPGICTKFKLIARFMYFSDIKLSKYLNVAEAHFIIVNMTMNICQLIKDI